MIQTPSQLGNFTNFLRQPFGMFSSASEPLTPPSDPRDKRPEDIKEVPDSDQFPLDQDELKQLPPEVIKEQHLRN